MRFGLALLFAWSGLASAEETLTYCADSSPQTFNPQLTEDLATFNATSRTIYDRLLDFEPGSTKVTAGLAESWTVTKDGKTYTFKLRPGVQFHSTDQFKPTRTFNADDVVFSFSRALQKDHPFHAVSGGKYVYFENLGLKNLIQKIEKIDDLTVKFVLRRPEAPLLAELAMGYAVILSEEYAKQLELAGMARNIDIEPVGTGPFQLDRYLKDSSIRYSAHPAYWRGRANIDKLVFTIVPEASKRFAKLKRGECQLMGEPDPQDLAEFTGQAKIKLVSQPGANLGYLAFNVKKAPFNKLIVRQAIGHALNRPAYVDSIYNKNALLAKNPMPPAVWGYADDTPDLTFDPEKAKTLLKKAGYAKGFEAELWTLPLSRPYNPSGRKLGELMQADLAKVGIRLRLVTFDWLTYLTKARQGEHQLIQLGWTSDSGDPDGFLRNLLGCSAISGGTNLARWCNSKYDRLVEKARGLNELQDRKPLYHQAQAVFHQHMPWIPIAHATVFRGHSADLEGYQISPLGLEDFYPLKLK